MPHTQWYLVIQWSSMCTYTYIHSLCKILRPEVWQTHLKMLDNAIIFHDTLIRILQHQLLQFFRNMKYSTIHHTVLIWVPRITTYSRNSRNRSGDLFQWLNELSSAMIREIRWLNKNQLLHRTERLLECWRVGILCEGITSKDYNVIFR